MIEQTARFLLSAQLNRAIRGGSAPSESPAGARLCLGLTRHHLTYGECGYNYEELPSLPGKMAEAVYSFLPTASVRHLIEGNKPSAITGEVLRGE